ncbi:MAG: tetratricopeptide repeat protein [Planctomycetes bacterium]|nr:tetratricopeptide repeat protein [Planctomycetota bacterium]
MKNQKRFIFGVLSGFSVAVIVGAAVIAAIVGIMAFVNRDKGSGQGTPQGTPVKKTDNRPLYEKMLLSWSDLSAEKMLKVLSAAAIEAIRQADRDPAFFTQAGDLAAERFDYQAAIAYYRKAVRLAPDNLDAQKGLANAMMLLRPECVERNVLAQAFLMRGDPSSGMEMLQSDFYLSQLDRQLLDVHRQIVRLARGDRTAKFNLAVTLMNMQMFEDAERLYKELLADDSKDVKSLYNLATICQIQKRLGEARDALKKVIELDATLPSAHASLGAVYMDFDQPENAMLAYAEAVKLDGQSAGLWGNFAISAGRAGSLGRAIFAARKSMELSPPDPKMCRLLGDLFFEIHRAKNDPALLGDAVQAWKKSIQLDPDQPKVREQIDLYSPVAPPGANNKPAPGPR